MNYTIRKTRKLRNKFLIFRSFGKTSKTQHEVLWQITLEGRQVPSHIIVLPNKDRGVTEECLCVIQMGPSGSCGWMGRKEQGVGLKKPCHIITLSTWRKGISSGGWEDRKQKTEIQEPLIPFFYPGIPRHVEDLRRGVSMGMPTVQIKAEM